MIDLVLRLNNMIPMGSMSSQHGWSEITIGKKEENLNLLYDSVIRGGHLELLGKTCKLFLRERPKSPHTNTLLRLAVQNQEYLTPEEKSEFWCEVLEKFSPGIAYNLGKKYLPEEWKEDYMESLFLQNGRISVRMKSKYKDSEGIQKLPEWMLRNPFGIAKKLKDSFRETKPVLDVLKERLPESYPAHTVLFVDAFLRRDSQAFYHHYNRSGRIQYHPQSLYMKAMIDIRNGHDTAGEKLIRLIRENIPGWEIPSFLHGGIANASDS